MGGKLTGQEIFSFYNLFRNKKVFFSSLRKLGWKLGTVDKLLSLGLEV